MNSLKKKTIDGMSWSFADNTINIGIQFLVGIILARLLTPQDFGLIGMITVIIALLNTFVDSGFSQALIRKTDCSDEDYSTVFIFNFCVSFIFYFILFFSAEAISDFFNQSQLILLIKVLGIVIIINAFGLIERTILTKRIDFKLQTKISIIASLTSGIAGITMAYLGLGVWSLVFKIIIQNFISSLLLWLWNRWNFKLVFDFKSFKEMFGFGSKVLLSGIINTLYRNIYYLVIGKYFSATELGYYTKAEQFKNLPSENLTKIIQRVSYPVLSSIQTDSIKLKSGYKKLIKDTMFISFISMIVLAAIAKSFIIVLIGTKWTPTILYLQILCFSGMLYPIHALNLNILQVKGRSDLFLILEVVKKILLIPMIIIGIIWGMKIMLLGMIMNSIIGYFLNSYWSGKLIDYPFKEQILDIAPSFFTAIAIGTIVYLTGIILPLDDLFLLLFQLVLSMTLIVLISNIFKLDEYFDIKEIIVKNIFKLN